MRLTDLLALSHAPRWTTVGHTRAQSVADHTFRVMVILQELCLRLGKPLGLHQMTYALCHDGAEALTGDIPGDFKERLPPDALRAAEEAVAPWLTEVPKLTADERRLQKLADQIETYTFIKIFGAGPHSLRVEEWCRERMMRSVLDNERAVVRTLIQDILEETDRD